MPEAKKPIAKTVVIKKEYIEPLNDFEKEVEETIDEPVIEKLKVKEKTANKWEVKDRNYYLIGPAPLTYMMKSKHKSHSPLLWFDKEIGEQKELRYATNQNSPFVKEQKGEVTLGHIMFKDGTLFVPKEKQNLQKLLSLYHPSLNKIYKELLV